MRESEQKVAAKAFAEKWNGVGDEKQHTQTFWLELLHGVYGVEQPFGFITLEDTVRLGHVSFIDATIPETHVMIEQKGLGKDLSKPIRLMPCHLLPFRRADLQCPHGMDAGCGRTIKERLSLLQHPRL